MSIRYVNHGFLVSTIYLFNLAYVISHLGFPASPFSTCMLSLLSLKCLLCFLSHKIELQLQGDEDGEQASNGALHFSVAWMVKYR